MIAHLLSTIHSSVSAIMAPGLGLDLDLELVSVLALVLLVSP